MSNDINNVMYPRLEIIAAVSKNLVIGKNNQLPWNIPEDLQHFKDLTKGHIVVMGKNTYLSIPQHRFPLKDRINIVVSSTHPEHNHENAFFVTYEELEDTIKDLYCEYPQKKCFIIGGSQLYESFIYKASVLHLTHIDKHFDGLAKFPVFNNFTMSKFSDKMFSEDEKCSYQFITYTVCDSITIVSDFKYLKFLDTILKCGEHRDDRTGTGTLSLFARQLRFDISDSVPLLTTKFVPWKACIKELLWFMKGQTDANILKEQGVNIWNGNTTRDFLDKRGLSHYPEGDIGAGYGFQWRHFGAEYGTCKDNYANKGFDQLQFVINELNNNPSSRRIYLSAWNPQHMHKMALPPCHISAQFYVSNDNELSCHMYQRSVDTFLGLPFNIFSYTALTYILATICGMTPKELIISTGDTHLYLDHIALVHEQLHRNPITPPKLIVNKRIKDIPIEQISVDDFDVVGYFHHNQLKGKMSV